MEKQPRKTYFDGKKKKTSESQKNEYWKTAQ